MLPKKYEQGSSLVWIAIGLTISVSSLQLKLGTLTEPGPGFMPLMAGLLLLLLALGHLLYVSLSKAARQEAVWREKAWGKVILTLAALWAYAFVLPRAGFLITTFCFMFFQFKAIESLRWPVALLAAVLSVALSSVLFTFLGAEFPKGILG